MSMIVPKGGGVTPPRSPNSSSVGNGHCPQGRRDPLRPTAAIKIQAVFRGNAVRRMLHCNEEFTKFLDTCKAKSYLSLFRTPFLEFKSDFIELFHKLSGLGVKNMHDFVMSSTSRHEALQLFLVKKFSRTPEEADGMITSVTHLIDRQACFTRFLDVCEKKKYEETGERTGLDHFRKDLADSFSELKRMGVMDSRAFIRESDGQYEGLRSLLLGKFPDASGNLADDMINSVTRPIVLSKSEMEAVQTERRVLGMLPLKETGPDYEGFFSWGIDQKDFADARTLLKRVEAKPEDKDAILDAARGTHSSKVVDYVEDVSQGKFNYIIAGRYGLPGVKRIPSQKRYLELATARHEGKVPKRLTQQLAGTDMAIVGCSLGSRIAELLVQMGACALGGKMRLVDFDTTDLKNLSRGCFGVHEVGYNKATTVREGVLSHNPYATVDVRDRITDSNFNNILAGSKIVFDQADCPYAKELCHRWAQENKVPVIMAYDAGGRDQVLTICRYDLHPDLQTPLHNTYLTAQLTATFPESGTEIEEKPMGFLKGLETGDKLAFMAKFIKQNPDGKSGVACGTAADVMALLKVKHGKLGGFPQLGGEAGKAGVDAVNAAMRILSEQIGFIKPDGTGGFKLGAYWETERSKEDLDDVVEGLVGSLGPASWVFTFDGEGVRGPNNFYSLMCTQLKAVIEAVKRGYSAGISTDDLTALITDKMSDLEVRPEFTECTTVADIISFLQAPYHGQLGTGSTCSAGGLGSTPNLTASKVVDSR